MWQVVGMWELRKVNSLGLEFIFLACWHGKEFVEGCFLEYVNDGLKFSYQDTFFDGPLANLSEQLCVVISWFGNKDEHLVMQSMLD